MKNLYNSALKNEKFDAIIIGSGLGGLTAASLLCKSKKKVLLLEKHYAPGGFTHTFKRGKFVWDVGVHYVGQMHDSESVMYKIFDYVSEGALQWAYMDEIYDKAIIGGEVFNFYSDPEKQAAYLIELFPQEEKAIRAYYKIIMGLGTSVSMFFGERTMPAFLSWIFGKLMKKKFLSYSDKTTYEVLRGLTNNEKLISVLCAQCGNYGLTPQKSSFVIQAIIANHYAHGGNYPVGGAASIWKTMLQVIENNGGKLALKAEAETILLDNNTAIGVRLKNGDELFAPIIISNAGVRNTFKHLLSADLQSCRQINESLEKISASTAHICLYIGLDASDQTLELPKYNYWLYNSFDFENEYQKHIDNPDSDPPLAYISFPSAKDPAWNAAHPNSSTIQVIAAASYAWVKKWENSRWAKRGEAYESFKENFKKKMLEKLYTVVPQIKGHIQVCEVSTPLSTKHFSNHPQGEIYGLEHTPERFRLNWLRVRTPVKNLYLTGQDIITVGVGGALFSGVLTASVILKKNLLGTVTKYKPDKSARATETAE